MTGLLKSTYRVKVATSGMRALAIAEAQEPLDLILLDVMMPEMDGYEVCRRLKASPRTADIPIIFLTARAEVEDEQLGLALGAVDYITKPISPPIVQARVRTHLLLKSARDFLQDKNAYLEQEVARRMKEIMAVQDATITCMGALCEARDNETGNHIRRTQHYMRLLAEHLRAHPKFAATLTDEAIELIYKSAPLHDIGKVGIPDQILFKPGKLSEEEFETMKEHVRIGRDAIVAAERSMELPSSFLRFAREIAFLHHEKWNGKGYLQGLRGEEIPISARLMAVADVYDALVTRRVYKPAFSHERAAGIILGESGQHFDPDVVAAFGEVAGRFREVARAYADAADDPAPAR
jgi:putative two-component system response regulator